MSEAFSLIYLVLTQEMFTAPLGLQEERSPSEGRSCADKPSLSQGNRSTSIWSIGKPQPNKSKLSCSLTSRSSNGAPAHLEDPRPEAAGPAEIHKLSGPVNGCAIPNCLTCMTG